MADDARSIEIKDILYNNKGRLGCPYCNLDMTPPAEDIANYRLGRTNPDGLQLGECKRCNRYFRITDKAMMEINEIWEKLQGNRGDKKLLQIFLDSVDETPLDGDGRIVERPDREDA